MTRVRALGQSLPPFVAKGNAPYWEIIEKQYKSIASDVQGLNAYRYSSNITGGNQEFMEALSFQHYLETQTLVSYEESQSRIAAMSGEGGMVLLTPEDYILGIFDMVGELMRFSITAMATNGKLPAGKAKKIGKQDSKSDDGDKMDVDEQTPVFNRDEEQPRNVLSDLRDLRLQLEMLEPAGGKFGSDVRKKAEVMRECVDKVEKALYGLTVRGSERPKGWVPDVREERRAEVESY
jgi:predicted translin family RNA/ssDNA-binding protein